MKDSTGLCSSKGGKMLSSSERLLSLKPLRDLAQNWDVDIASCLEEYLQELESAGHCVSVDLPSQLFGHNIKDNKNSNATTNFAQAAVLLQNSSSVYGRKVEYLHSLVYASLEKLLATSANHSGNEKNRNSVNPTQLSSTTRNTSRNDKDVLRFQAYDQDCQFLLLDDVLPIDSTGTKINLKSTTAATTNQRLRDSNITLDENLQFNTTRLSLGGSLSVTKAEITASSHDQINVIHTAGNVTKKGDAQPAATNAMILETLFSESGGGNGNLRLMSGVCDINCGGALIMPGAICDASEHRTIDVERIHGTNTPNDNCHPIAMLTGEKLDLSVEGYPNSGSIIQGDGKIEKEDLDQFEDYNDHNDDGIGFELAHNDVEQLGTPLSSNEQYLQSVHQRCAEGENAQRVTRGTTPDKNNTATITSKQDPWVMLDPHCGLKSKHKPLRVGITYQLPNGMHDTPSNSVTGSHTKNTYMRQSQQKLDRQKPLDNQEIAVMGGKSSDICLAAQAYRAILDAAENDHNINRSHQPKRSRSTSTTRIEESTKSPYDFLLFPFSSNKNILSLKHLAYGEEFLYAVKAQKKQKAAERRKILRIQVEQNAESSEAAKVHEKFNNIYNDDNDDNCGEEPFGFDDYGGDDDHHDDGLHDDNQQPGEENTNFANFDHVFCNSDSSNDDVKEGRDGISVTGMTFDALCRAHLHEFAKGAEKYAIETQLSKRVKKWQNKLAVILDEEEERPDFDIRKYQKWILDSAAKVIKKKKNNILIKEDQHNELNLIENVNERCREQRKSSSNAIDFASITRNKEQHEVSRLFLSSLMLCNTNNIVLRHAHSNEVATPDELKIDVLSFEFSSLTDSYVL